MSSSTVTDTYITEPWIHMQQQGYVARKPLYDHQQQQPSTRHQSAHKATTTTITTTTTNIASKDSSRRRQSYTSSMIGGTCYAKSSTAAATTPQQQHNTTLKELMHNGHAADTGMSQNGIYEAFAQLDDDSTTAATAAAKNQRRKSSVALNSIRRKSCTNRQQRPTMADESEQPRPMNRTSKATTTVTSLLQSKRMSHGSSTVAARIAAINSKSSSNDVGGLRGLQTKKSTESITQQQQQQQRRGTLGRSRHSPHHHNHETSSLSSSSSDRSTKHGPSDTDDGYNNKSNTGPKPTRNVPVKTFDPEKERGTGFVLRDVLAVKRRQVRQELGLSSDAATKRHQQQQQQHNRQSAPPAPTTRTSSTHRLAENRRKSTTAYTATTDAARRRTKEKTATTTTTTTPKNITTTRTSPAANLPTSHETRRRTLSNGSILRQSPIKNDTKTTTERRRKSIASVTTATTARSDTQSYSRPTLAELRRRSTANANNNDEASSLAMLTTKRRSIATTTTATSRRASKVDTKNSSSNGRRSSEAGSRKGSPSTTSSPGDVERSQTTKRPDLNRRMSKRGSMVAQQQQQQPATMSPAARTRKKSIVAMDDSALTVRRRTRRMSRTESLKEGVPTDVSLDAAKDWRKKSDAAREAFAATTKAATVRKIAAARQERRKTLPGSLATPPPPGEALNLPPMKVEPIRLNIPGTRRTKPSRSRSSTRGHSASSEEEASTPRDEDNTKRTRKELPQLHVAITGGHHSSSKHSPGSQRDSAIDVLSPRSRALHALQSAGNRTSHPNEDDALSSPSMSPRARKMSAAAAAASSNDHGRTASFCEPSSRKGSVASTLDNDPVNDLQRNRAMSLQGRLKAMVRQHTEHPSTATNTQDVVHHYQPLKYRHAAAAAARLGVYDTTDTTKRQEQPATSPTPAVASLNEGESSSPTMIRSPARLSDTLLWDKELADIAAVGLPGPKSPTTAIKFYSAFLSPYEHTEIQEYSQVYFVGHHAEKHMAVPDDPTNNFGYDDEHGDYNIIVQDHLAYRYEIMDILGCGSFGQVIKCYDHKMETTVAIKMIRNKRRLYAQARTEVNILKDLVKWDPHDQHHNIRLTDSFVFRNHLCIVCECLSINLYEFIKANNYKGFSLSLIKRFNLQLLQSLCLLYEHGVIHCDLKPENILLKHPAKSTIKVIDFGSSCFENDRVYTYIQSRYYRSPEVILGMSYNAAIDMWSLGCILAELYTGTPLFPGEDEQEQLGCIMEILGVPSRYIIEQCSRRRLFFDSSGNPRIIPNSKGKRRRPGTKSLSHALRGSDRRFIDFVYRCLQWDPRKRMTPDQALCHEWMLYSSRHGARKQSSAVE